MASTSSPVVLVTGASSGIGLATAKVLASKGFRVVLAARSLDKLTALAKDITDAGGVATAIATDVSREADVAAAFAHAESAFGQPVRHVFANAGVELVNPLDTLTEADIDKVTSVNVKGSLFTAKHAIAALRKSGGGTVIFTSSVAARLSSPKYVAASSGFGTYSASKAAVDMVGRALHAYSGEGIRSFTILPGVFGTAMADRAAASMGAPSTDAITGFNPVHKTSVGDPADIGKLVTSLIDGSNADFASGDLIVVDNGTAFNAQVLTNSLDARDDWPSVPRDALRSVSGGAFTGDIVAPPAVSA